MANAMAAAIDMTTTTTVTRDVDTSDSILRSGGPPAGGRDGADGAGGAGRAGGEPLEPPRRRALAVVAASLVSLVVVAGITAGVVRIPYDSVAPGTTRVVNDLITVSGPPTFPPEGEVLYATVSVRERISLLQAFIGWLDPSTDVIAEERIRGDIPPDRYHQLNVEAMSDSKTTAQVLALARLGYTDLGAGARIESVAEGSPASAVLRAGDVVIGIDGSPVRTSEDAVKAIRAHQPGESLRLVVERSGGPPLELAAELARADDGRPLLGVRLSTEVELPFPIEIDSGKVVGPSAGLAYALELLDLLTAGELTGGVRVAATGELSPSGQVGPVGGVGQKVVAVRRAGAQVFLVPKANEAEARARAGDRLRVIGVASFDEALTALGSVQGSNALALARPDPGA